MSSNVLIADETSLLKSIELEKNEQCIISCPDHPQAQSRGIQRFCWCADEIKTVDSQRNVVLARADCVVESYEASHSNNPSNTGNLVWSWPAPDNTQRMARLERDNPLSFYVDGGIHVMHLEPEVQSCIGVGGKEHDLNLWSLKTQQVLFKDKNVSHDKLDMRVHVWIKHLRFFIFWYKQWPPRYRRKRLRSNSKLRLEHKAETCATAR
ncbi:Uncharacterized conserved protein [Plasmopara halstedii]|uniref:Uncharacterized conserved protein n=1 Tax=Plasmopara halstedii TaxID=4781 RepID=A0A0P1AVU3_PLAHL|nr:Uncharacterized conserved protein [Plasmopara halstedii]CEG45265.1 Uncharacterized conserved protein [Plasmopara halstedii]|eukprot:XP_024581634.1 Uncharacterized conserved protein [Plasmopara halstedii]